MEVVNSVENLTKIWLPLTDVLIMLTFVSVTMLIIHFLPKLTKAVSSSLVTIILDKSGYHLQNVQDFAGMELRGGLPKFHILQVTLSFEIFKIITPYAVIAALVGLTETVLTLQVIDEMTDTRSRPNKECIAQGLANTVNGFFGGMVGDAMIDQSIINIKSGGRTRLSGLVAAFSLLMFIMFGSNIINTIPLVALVGVMFMVVVGIFKWQSLKYRNKVSMQDIIVIIVVSIVTIFADLSTAVIIGVILSALIFAWEKGKVIYVNIEENEDGSKTYKINGSIFFGSVLNYKELFDIQNDPDNVIVDFKYAKVMDHSAIEAIDSIAAKYRNLGKTMTLIRLSKDCNKLFENAHSITTVDIGTSTIIPSQYKGEDKKLFYQSYYENQLCILNIIVHRLSLPKLVI